MTMTLDDILATWATPEGRPYKDSLIDIEAYYEHPDNIGCMCAQGQVLHLMGGWSATDLRDANQKRADLEVARLLGISRAHAVLLRDVNDSVDGAPAVVLTHPGRVLGDEAATILAFWRYLDTLTVERWNAAGAAAGAAVRAAAWNAAGAAARAAAGDTAWAAAWNAVRAAAWNAAGAAAGAAVRDAVQNAAGAAAGAAVRDAVQNAAWAAAWDAAWAAAGATAEIQGARVLRERGQPFVFLPAFGFATPEEIIR